MNHLAIHPIEYLRLHVHYEGVWIRVLIPLRTFCAKVLESAEQTATIAIVLLTVGLVIFGFMKIGESASIAANYDAAITEIVFPPLQAIPTGM